MTMRISKERLAQLRQGGFLGLTLQSHVDEVFLELDAVQLELDTPTSDEEYHHLEKRLAMAIDTMESTKALNASLAADFTAQTQAHSKEAHEMATKIHAMTNTINANEIQLDRIKQICNEIFSLNEKLRPSRMSDAIHRLRNAMALK